MAILLTEHWDGTAADWTQLDESDATTSAPGVWAVSANNDMRQSSNIFGSSDLPRVPGTFLIYDNGFTWKEYTMDIRVDSTDNDNIGFMVYYEDVNNYIQFRTTSQGNESVLWQKVGGVQTELASETFAYNVAAWYQYEVMVEPAKITIKRNNQVLFGGSINHSGQASGTIALYSAGNTLSIFDSIIVKDNEFPPGGMTSPRIATIRSPITQSIGRIA